MRPDPPDAGQPISARQQEASAGAAFVWAWLRQRYGVVAEFRLERGVHAWHVQQDEPAGPFEVQFTVPALDAAEAQLDAWLRAVAAHAAGPDAAIEPDYYRVTSHGVAMMPGESSTSST